LTTKKSDQKLTKTVQKVAKYRQKKTTPNGVVNFHDSFKASIGAGFEWFGVV